MFEEKDNINEFDLMVKSILDEGREEIPVRVWEGVSEGLDKAARRRRVVLWWRSAAVSVAAAAAVAVALVFNHSADTVSVPDNGEDGLIAVVQEKDREEGAETDISVADAMVKTFAAPAGRIPQTASEAIIASENVTPEPVVTSPETSDDETVSNQMPATEKASTDDNEYFPEDWGEDEARREISFTVSGLASTNSTQNKQGVGPMKAPNITSAPKKTGISETSTNSIYGLPLSFGAGVRIGLTQDWSIGTGLNYTVLTRQFYGKYIKVDEDGSVIKSTSSDIRNTQHYIGIPLNAYYDIVNKDRINLYAYAGGAIEKCVSDNYSVLSTAIRHKEKAKGIQVSANIGIGVEFMLGKHLGLYIDPSARYYFNNGQPKSIRTEQPLMFGFEMGLRAIL